MNLLMAVLLTLGIAFYLRFAFAMLQEIRHSKPRAASRHRTVSPNYYELAASRFEFDPKMTKLHVKPQKWLSPILGAACCTAAAALLSVLFRNSSFNTVLPFCFLVMVLLVAIWFGFAAAFFGTIFAGAIFALLMFKPFYSFSVQSQAARNSLLWMSLGGIALAELFSHHPPDPGKPHFRRRVGF